MAERHAWEEQTSLCEIRHAKQKSAKDKDGIAPIAEVVEGTRSVNLKGLKVWPMAQEIWVSLHKMNLDFNTYKVEYDLCLYIHIHNTWCGYILQNHAYSNKSWFLNSQASLSSSVFVFWAWPGMDTIDKATWFKWYSYSFDVREVRILGYIRCVNLWVDVHVLWKLLEDPEAVLQVSLLLLSY